MFFFLSAISSLCIWTSCIEPNLVRVTRIIWPLTKETAHLENLKIVFISDLHIKKKIPSFFLKKIMKKINSLSPDLILFGGDFICQASLDDPYRLEKFFSSFSPKYGIFGVLGNHDYDAYISQMNNNEIKIVDKRKGRVIKKISSSVKYAFSKTQPPVTFHPQIQKVSQNLQLINLLEKIPIHILHNKTHVLPIGLNIVGLGEYMLQKTDPASAYLNYDSQLPGITLVHNPNAIAQILSYPGDWILSGHTHGQQINPPGLNFFKKFSTNLVGVQDSRLIRGLTPMYNPLSLKLNKYVYVSRGLSSGGLRIRLNSMPEITYIHCKL